MSAGISAGSGRPARLDPFALPVRYRTGDAGADECERIIEICRDRVIMQRAVRGIAMKVSTKVSDFLGVAIRIVPPKRDFDGAIAVMLEHRDPGLSVPLFVAADGKEISVEWRTWARVLGLPALVEDADGALRDPFDRLGRAAGTVKSPRRPGHTVTRARRGIGRLRRKAGVLSADSIKVHACEREIIARN
ncbi:MAG: DUF6101 family protein [Microvirga sp.]